MPFRFINNKLHLVSEKNQIDLNELVKSRDQAFYLYDSQGIQKRCIFLKNAFKRNIRVHYAMKANNHPEVLKIILSQGFGIDAVSIGEIKQAIQVGFSGDKIIFSGVAKTRKEIEFAIDNKISQINVESPEELERIGSITKAKGLRVNVAFRMNPDIQVDTHPYIATGFRNNKFGMDISLIPDLLEILKSYPLLSLVGLTLHIGSQIKEIAPFIDAIIKIKQIYMNLQNQGFSLKTFDIGGGLGINYQNEDLDSDEKFIQNYASAVEDELNDLDCDLLLEPGRILVGSFGLLLAEVQYIKNTPWKKFLITNTGMHHLMRPSLYQAYHRILPLNDFSNVKEIYDVVGPICESADVLAQARQLPNLKSGDWIAIADVGAYGRVMSSNYNSHDFPEELII